MAYTTCLSFKEIDVEVGVLMARSAQAEAFSRQVQYKWFKEIDVVFFSIYKHFSPRLCSGSIPHQSNLYYVLLPSRLLPKKKKRIYRAQFDKKQRPISGPTPTYTTNVWLEPRGTLTLVNRAGSGQAFC